MNSLILYIDIYIKLCLFSGEVYGFDFKYYNYFDSIDIQYSINHY